MVMPAITEFKSSINICSHCAATTTHR